MCSDNQEVIVNVGVRGIGNLIDAQGRRLDLYENVLYQDENGNFIDDVNLEVEELLRELGLEQNNQ